MADDNDNKEENDEQTNGNIIPNGCEAVVAPNPVLGTEWSQAALESALQGVAREMKKKQLEGLEKTLYSSKQTIDENVEEWVSAFQQFHADYSSPREETQEEEFAKMYHELIHSPALSTLLQLEQTYASNRAELVAKRDRASAKLHSRHMKEMDKAVTTGASDKEINNIAARHTRETAKVENHFINDIAVLQQSQLKDYRDFVNGVFLAEKSAPASPTKPNSSYRRDMEDDEPSTPTRRKTKKKSESSSAIGRMLGSPTESEAGGVHEQRLEESFTVLLGTQQKTMHNVRVIAGSPLDLCKHQPTNESQTVDIQAERLSTAMSLYSQELRGMVLLVDNRLSSATGIKAKFTRVCEESTDFHFPSIEDQMETLKREADLDSSKLNNGDFYITRHSNLSECHVVFHLVGETEAASDSFNARSPVMLGARNIIRCAFHSGVLNLSIPLLMMHEVPNEMDDKACLRRAELVLKCVKGFIMETSISEGSIPRTFQFLVPENTSHALFEGYSSLFSNIFRISGAMAFTS
eukprot:m.40559 g.40559  ORF g.40559 m.40559 type:complete len:523 (-) comp9678_c0_seq2:126-1694(-)